MIRRTKKFKCADGKTYKFPVKHCAFCDHCTDIFFDYTNGPYMFLCENNHEDFRTCKSFKKER